MNEIAKMIVQRFQRFFAEISINVGIIEKRG
jgi:hypothetical protein